MLFQIRRMLSDWKNTIIVVVAVVSAFIASVEYSKVRSEIKEDRSLQYIKHFYSELIARHFYLIELSKKLVADAYAPADADEEKKLLTYHSAIVNELTENESSLIAIYQHLHFFDMVTACVDVKLCDRSIIDDLLKQKIEKIFTLFSPYICQSDNEDSWLIPQNYAFPSESKDDFCKKFDEY